MDRPASRSLPVLSWSLDRLWPWVLAALLLLFTETIQIDPHDFWWYVRVGERIWTTRAIPTVDLFSYTRAGAPFVYHSWLASLAWYGVVRAGGPALVLAVQSGVLLAVYLLLYRAARRRGATPALAAVLVLLFALVGAHNWAVRPQTFSLLYFLIALTLLERLRWGEGSSRELFLLIPLTLLWVNTHGAFPLAFALVGLTWLGEGIGLWRGTARISRAAWRRLTGVGIGMGLALLVNPRGLGVLGYVYRLLTDRPSQKLVIEWQPPTPRDLVGKLIFLAVLASFLVLLSARRELDLTDLLLYAVFLWAGWTAIRYVIWWTFVTVPILAGVLAARWPHFPYRRPPRPSRGSPLLNGLLLLLLGAAVLLGSPWVRPRLPLPHPERLSLLSPETPVGAAQYLKTHPVGARLYHDMGYGSYFIWALWPQYRVFADPRIELYPYEFWLDYKAVADGQWDYARILDRYGIETLVLDLENQYYLIQAIEAQGGWREVYRDDRSVIFVRAP